MITPRVYVETTIPSFYYEERTASGIVARREWTQVWWESGPDSYELVTSAAVLDELAGGIPERAAKRLALSLSIPSYSYKTTDSNIRKFDDPEGQHRERWDVLGR